MYGEKTSKSNGSMWLSSWSTTCWIFPATFKLNTWKQRIHASSTKLDCRWFPFQDRTCFLHLCVGTSYTMNSLGLLLMVTLMQGCVFCVVQCDKGTFMLCALVAGKFSSHPTRYNFVEPDLLAIHAVDLVHKAWSRNQQQSHYRNFCFKVTHFPDIKPPISNSSCSYF